MIESPPALKRKQSVDIDSPMPSSGPPSPSDSSDAGADQAKVKRVRTTAEMVSKKKTVSKLIATLSASQLVHLVTALVDTHPQLADDVASLVPRPTIDRVQSHLVFLETKLQEAFPYTKWGPGRDDYSFNRVKPALEELIENIVEYTNHFTSPPEFPTTSFSFLHIAAECCNRLPNWDSAANNELKTSLYRSLEEFWIKTIQDAASKLEEGKIFGQATVREWANNLDQHNYNSQGLFSTAVEEFKSRLGWLLGFPPSTPHYPNPMSTASPHNTGNSNNNSSNGINGNGSNRRLNGSSMSNRRIVGHILNNGNGGNN
ncbi:Tethering factor for nuclear proteasome sts1 [Lunasporangiospora selenospora]|uniref:Tethering factor for nuclear proteasome STS1 n=1 Tax=Lunasporangiospora selenospora TaxID=979761 RepID=A0A9P6FMA7_9FUNG|nr:Tethering factor for nuclear proteasome sts1 [Lunasporangiospora selenospora]